VSFRVLYRKKAPAPKIRRVGPLKALAYNANMQTNQVFLASYLCVI